MVTFAEKQEEVHYDGALKHSPPADEAAPKRDHSAVVSVPSEGAVLRQKAQATRAGFQRPAFWVLAFGWSLALCAGIVNVVAKEAFGTYVSHATGDTTVIGLRIEGYHRGRHDFEPLAAAIAVLLSFLAGAFLCGILIDKNQVHFGGKALYGTALVGNGLLLVLSVMAEEQHLTGACLAAAACGLQNAMCTSHFGAVVRTTHVTGTLTDIGSTTGRIAMLFLRRGCRRSRLNVLERAEVGVDARKLLVLAPMWCSFLGGCVIGAYLYQCIQVYAMLVPAGFTFTIGLAYTLFRLKFKTFFKKMLAERLSEDLDDVETILARTRQYLSDRRKAGPAADAADAGPDLVDLEAEVEQILESIQQVEADLDDLRVPIREPSRASVHTV